MKNISTSLLIVSIVAFVAIVALIFSGSNNSNNSVHFVPVDSNILGAATRDSVSTTDLLDYEKFEVDFSNCISASRDANRNSCFLDSVYTQVPHLNIKEFNAVNQDTILTRNNIPDSTAIFILNICSPCMYVILNDVINNPDTYQTEDDFLDSFGACCGMLLIMYGYESIVE
jgi:hypothetical protein